ncbi:MAG: glycosyltransferase family 4 protein [Desulfobacteraceae bacterium]|nr:glycosyltransferase family 4 protein [Desulfobacteraceae bacterium]
MNIGIEITKAHHKDGGCGVYPRKLIKNMLQLDKDNQYFIFTSEPIEELNQFVNCHQIPVPSSDGMINFLKLYCTFRNIIKKYDINILHLLSLYGIYRPPKMTVSTVFDLRHLVASELNERKLGKMIYKFWLPYLLKHSCHLIAISEETKKSVNKYFNIPKEKITTTYMGHEIGFHAESELKSDTLPEKYFMWVGMITKRKNLEVLYKAFSIFIKNCPDYRLVIVGKFLNSKIENTHKKLIGTLKTDNDVIFTGYVKDDELRALYKNATAFIFPSVYEGFGIPIIEAMALETPVITTIDGGATREVAGDAALFFKKYDANELVKRMMEITFDDKLRNELINRGRQRASEFTWKETAVSTLEVYRKIARNFV